jgi:putative phosphoesterase
MPRVGVISDTHGLLRPEAVTFLRGCRRLIHAGDIGSAAVLEELAAIAPVTAVRGNNDHGAWARRLPETVDLAVDSVRVHVIHDLSQLDLAPRARRPDIVISGHSHKPVIVRRDGTLLLNPGSAGPRRFKLPVSIAEIVVDASGRFDARIVELEVATGRPKPAAPRAAPKVRRR